MAVLKKVLYADDDVDDRAWVADACEQVAASLEIDFVENGRQVLDYLRSEKDETLPGLIVLDINMPELDGRQTLQQIKATPQFKHIPVAVLTTAANRIDSEVCARLGAAVYLTKPASHAAWQKVIKDLEPLIL